MQDPQIQLLELGIAVPDAIHPDKAAVLDVAHRSFVNYETYFFADEDDKRRFDADPTASCGILTDPVTKDRFIIGRGKQSSDLTIKDPNVSRQHAMIEFLNGQYYIVDMGSTNGVE